MASSAWFQRRRAAILVAPVNGHVPAGQGPVIGRSEFVGRFHRFEHRDGLGQLALLGQEVAQREPPPIVGRSRLDP